MKDKIPLKVQLLEIPKIDLNSEKDKKKHKITESRQSMGTRIYAKLIQFHDTVGRICYSAKLNHIFRILTVHIDTHTHSYLIVLSICTLILFMYLYLVLMIFRFTLTLHWYYLV
ncbi:hypothetical protein HZS_6319 [Henneguya salminicola]|nr:hypothetical protein HZS_6319 [Henneguya salminicola]